MIKLNQPGKSVNSNEIKPATRDTGQKNNVFTDKKGDVYRKKMEMAEEVMARNGILLLQVEKAKPENQTEQTGQN